MQAAAREVEEAGAFEGLVARVRPAVDRALASLLDARVEAARAHGPDVVALVDAVRSLSMRGGKRLRAVLVAAGYEACGGGAAADVVMAGVSMELLQTYLLIHDDVMDGDEVRRGGPSVHAMLRERYGSAKAGEHAAILAGDLAAALAEEALLAVPCAPARVAEASRELSRMQEEVVYGQLLDMRAGAATAAAVERMHELKTASYTVRGPLLVGALLAGASAAQKDALERFARPLGVAFQLRDDLLGTFGDPRATGKPSGSDLRSGKRTALAVEIEKDPEARALAARIASESARDEDVAALVALLEQRGARARVEARVEALVREAENELAAAPVQRAALAGAMDALSSRER